MKGNKSKIRSMRFSDDVYEMIERQAGESFSQKFDTLVTRCFYELPAKERELRRVEQQIDHQRKELERLIGKVDRYRRNLDSIGDGLDRCRHSLDDLSKM